MIKEYLHVKDKYAWEKFLKKFDNISIYQSLEWFNILNKTIDGLNWGTRAFFGVIEDIEDYIKDTTTLKIPIKSSIQSGVGDLQLDNIKLKEEKTFVDASKAIITSIDDFTRTFGQLLGKIPGCDKKD